MPQVSIPPAYPTRKRRFTDPFISPIENYKPSPEPAQDMGIPEGQMMDMTARDRENFPKWMEENGGYHLDDATGRFAPDGPQKPGVAQKLSEWLKEGYINPGNAIFKVAEPLLKVGKAGASAFPEFLDQAKQAPGQALNDMASYEKLNPLGSALSFTGNVVAGKTARGFKQAEELGRVFGGAVDKLPRFEIADNAAKLTGAGSGKLGDILDHPELFNQYPELKDINVAESRSKSNLGSYNPETNAIELAPLSQQYPYQQTLKGDSRKSTLLHEVQHAIQEREGFARGGNVAEFSAPASRVDALKRIDELKNISMNDPNQDVWEEISRLRQFLQDSDPHSQYTRLAGETESRNVQGRMNMSDAERQAKPFNETFDVPVENQIKRMKSGPMADFLSQYERMKS